MHTAPDRKSVDASARETDPLGWRRRLGRALAIVLATAGATAWVQVSVVFVRREVLGHFAWAYWLRDQLLLSTIGYLLVFAVLALLPIAAHMAWPRRYSFTALLGTMTAVASFSVLLLFDRIAPLAWLLVSIGVGVQAHRVAAAHPRGTWRTLSRVAILAPLASILLGLGALRLRAFREGAALASAVAAPDGAPNVLLLVLDTVRAASLGLYGAPWETTPALAARAREGVVFDAAFSTAPWTLPSHASMFTGRYASQTTADWQSPLDGTAPTMAEAFRAHGYATGGFVANINIAGYRSGLARGFHHYVDAKLSVLEALHGTTLMQSRSATRAARKWAMTHWISGTVRALLPLEPRPMSTNPRHDDQSATDIVEAMLDWLPSTRGRPFFAFLNLFDAHGPMPPPMRYRTLFGPQEDDHALYSGAIRYMDDAIESLLGELGRRGVLDQTIVIVTSDHGEQFGEHGLRLHGNSLYRQLLHVPLVILNAPGGEAGRRVQVPVSLRDLPATILDLAAVPHTLPGTSLRPLLGGAGEPTANSPVLSELSRGIRNRMPDYMLEDRKSLVDDSSHVIRTASGAMEVYASPSDSTEAHDRGGDPAVRQQAERRMEQVLRLLGLEWRS